MNTKPHIPQRVDMYCKQCGSRDVTRDATAYWSIPDQTWLLSAVHDAAHCEQCGGQSTLGEAKLNP